MVPNKNQNSKFKKTSEEGAEENPTRLGLPAPPPAASASDASSGSATPPSLGGLVERDGDGARRGADPRRIGAVALAAEGLTPASPMAAIRAKCLDCCAGAPSEVRACVAIACALWPFRMRKNPWRAPMSDERREATRQRFAARRGGAIDDGDESEEEAENEADLESPNEKPDFWE